MYIENKQIKKYITYWLGLMFWLVVIMIIVGGLTRLTDSGLSITQWELFSGILPPINDIQWNVYFELYKQIPEFKDALDRVEKSISKDAEYVIRYKKGHPKHGKAYEVGVVPHPYKRGEYTLMTDFYQNGYGLFEAKGLGGHKQVEKDGKTIDDWGQELRQRYTVVAMRNRAQKEGKKVTKVEKLEDGSVRMEISE